MRNLLLIALSVLLSLEAVGWLSVRLTPQLYNDWQLMERTIRHIAKKEKWQLKAAQEMLKNPDYLRPADTRQEPNCLGEKVTYTEGRNGERSYAGFSPAQAQVLLVGDSYTYGTDVNDNQTIAAVIARSGIPAANLGHPGYDPLQALLYAQRWRRQYPAARVVVLGVMYENINRLAASYWPVYTKTKPNRIFEFKPYMDNGKVVMPAPGIYDSVDTVVEAAHKAFQDDFWARPDPGFPYSVALLRLISSKSFRNSMLMSLGTQQGQTYRYQYQNEELSNNLRTVLRMFTEWAQQEKLAPVVFFIPRSPADTQSGAQWIARNRETLPPQLQLHNVDFTTITATRYNLRPNGTCHPSPYGYAQVAAQVEAAVRPLLQPEAP